MKNIFFGVLVFLFLGCATTSVSNRDPILALSEQTEVFARERAGNVKNVSYDLNLILAKEGSTFSGIQKVQFDLKESRDVYLDFQGGAFTQVLINGKEAILERSSILAKIPKELLRQEGNIVILEFTQAYSRSGAGLHRFQDPEDGNVYLYSDFQPYDASRMAPFFDQPDIRAPLGLTVTAPADWVVVGNGKVFANEDIGTNKKWKFTRTESIASYLYAVMAGPYVYKEARYGKLSMRLYSRKTMAQFIPYDEWFKVTRQGLAFFENYFQVRYPFQKYDQLIVPEFNSGAMENVGAVTFSERYVGRGDMTRTDRLHFYNVVLHEMAHQWFGNLVTMRWWNDLWLNESFASFMAPLAQATATQYKEAWQYFHDDKIGAYIQDMSSTTHPIAATVANTNEAYSNFDDITYGKGASVLQQLYYYLGAKDFQRGLRNYFKTYAWQNTELKNFISSFETPNQEGLNPWFQKWLETTDVDRIATQVTCEVRTQKLQFDFSAKTVRPHALKVARLRSNQGQLVDLGAVELRRMPRHLTDSSATIETSGQACPDFIYPNAQDQGYVQVQFSEKDIQFLEKHIQQVTDATTRLALWSDLWQHVREGKMSLQRYSKMARFALATESEFEILDFLTGRSFGTTFNSVYVFWPKNSPAEMMSFYGEAKEYEAVLRTRIEKTKSNSDLNKILTSAWIESVVTQEGIAKLRDSISEMKDTEVRWSAILALCNQDFVSGEKFAKTELSADSSDYAKKNALACKVRNPDAKEKNFWLAELSRPKVEYSADEVRRISRNLFVGMQRPQISQYQDKIYRALKEVWPDMDEVYQDRIVSSLAPLFCDENAHQKLFHFVGQSQKLPSSMRIALLDKLDEDRVCLTVAKALKTSEK